MGQRLQGLAQPHVVGQHAAAVEFAQGLHPAQAFELVGPQFGAQALRRGRRTSLETAQAAGEVAQVVAAFPGQRQLVEIGQARRVRRAQAQLALRFGVAQVEVGKRRQHRLQAAEGQRHAQRRVEFQAQHQLLFVGVPGEGARIEQGRAAADQLGQSRQQADPLSGDLDAQFQLEPLAVVGFLDLGVPGVDGRQVVGEVGADVDEPALLAQARQVVLHEVQPGVVAGQFEHLAGAFLERVAAPGRRLEAEAAQGLAVFLLVRRTPFDTPLGLPWLAAGTPGNRLAGIDEGQRRAVPGNALHASAAQVVAAVHVAAEGQPRIRPGRVDGQAELGVWGGG